MEMVRFDWYMTKFKEQFVRYKNDDQHYICYQELCKLQQILNSNWWRKSAIWLDAKGFHGSMDVNPFEIILFSVRDYLVTTIT